MEFGVSQPSRPYIYASYKEFCETCWAWGQPSVCGWRQSGEDAESFVICPQKSRRRSSGEENWTILRKHLRMKCYRFQSVKAIRPNHNAKRFKFCYILNVIVRGKLVYRLLSTCQGKLTRKSHDLGHTATFRNQHVRDSAKVNVSLSTIKVYEPFSLV
jgi:hypothetical protein